MELTRKEETVIEDEAMIEEMLRDEAVQRLFTKYYYNSDCVQRKIRISQIL